MVAQLQELELVWGWRMVQLVQNKYLNNKGVM